MKNSKLHIFSESPLNFQGLANVLLRAWWVDQRIIYQDCKVLASQDICISTQPSFTEDQTTSLGDHEICLVSSFDMAKAFGTNVQYWNYWRNMAVIIQNALSTFKCCVKF